MRESVWSRGAEYIRYPESASRSSRRYFYTSQRQALHRAVWENANGPIPEGAQIHHKDGDTLNNDISNLVAVTPAEHASEHEDMYSEEYKQFRRQHLEKIRPLTVAWHGSEEGLAWHKKHGRESYKTRVPVDRVCIQCGKNYQSMARRDTDRFCSRPCISRHNEATKRYYEFRECAACGAPFQAKKGKKQQSCSRKCGWVLRRIKTAKSVQPGG